MRVISAAFKCDHCGAAMTTAPGATVRAFMRELRNFERSHNVCALAACSCCGRDRCGCDRQSKTIEERLERPTAQPVAEQVMITPWQ